MIIISCILQAGLAKLLGLAGDTNVQASGMFFSLYFHFFSKNNPPPLKIYWRLNWFPKWKKGEEQKKLDVLSNEVFVKALISSGRTVSQLFSFIGDYEPNERFFILKASSPHSAFLSLKKMNWLFLWISLTVESACLILAIFWLNIVCFSRNISMKLQMISL